MIQRFAEYKDLILLFYIKWSLNYADNLHKRKEKSLWVCCKKGCVQKHVLTWRMFCVFFSISAAVFIAMLAWKTANICKQQYTYGHVLLKKVPFPNNFSSSSFSLHIKSEWPRTTWIVSIGCCNYGVRKVSGCLNMRVRSDQGKGGSILDVDISITVGRGCNCLGMQTLSLA